MKSFNILTICLLCLVFFSCDAGHNKVLPVKFGQMENLVAVDSAATEPYPILNPVKIVSSEDSIWMVEDGRSEDLVRLLSSSGQCCAKGIGMGDGPDEVLEITSMHRIGGHTLIYDARKGIVSRIDRTDSVLHLSPLASSLRLFDDAVVLPGGEVLYLPVTQGYSYGLLDAGGALLDSLRYYPAKPQGVSDFTHALACTGFLAVLPDGHHFARTLVYDGGIDFFTVSDHSIAHTSRVESYEMDYAVLNAGRQVPTLSLTTRVGYRSLVASDDKFYALFSDHLAAEWQGGFFEIQVFTPDGLPYRKYVLDREVSKIAVTPDNAILYGVGLEHDEKITLYIFRLS